MCKNYLLKFEKNYIFFNNLSNFLLNNYALDKNAITMRFEKIKIVRKKELRKVKN